VASAIIGASRPEQVTANATAAGVTLSDETQGRIDSVLGHLAEYDPARTHEQSPKSRET